MSPSGGTVSKGDFIQFIPTPDEDWVSIYYTLDGTDPKSSGTRVVATTKGFTITQSCTVRAYASGEWSSGRYGDSDVISKTFTVTTAPQKKRTIHVEEAGTLSQFITESEKTSITDLTLSGKLNGSDLRLLRYMAGISYERDASTALIVTNGKLSVLDLRDVTFVKGGNKYIDKAGYTTDSDDLPEYAFAWCPRLTKIYLPRKSIKLNYFALHWLENLEEVELPEGLVTIEENFCMCINLKSLSIPSCVTSIHYSCFSTYGQSGGLSTVYCYATEPPIVEYSFPRNLQDATLYIPIISEEKYKNAAGWKDFNSILPKLNVYPTSIKTAKSSLTMKTGDTFKLSYSYDQYPSNTPINTKESPSVTWDSDNESVVIISSDGTIMAVGLGTAKVSVTSANGLSASCDVTVIQQAPLNMNVKQVTSGHFHTMILNTDGSLWACGYNNNGRLGIGNKNNQYSPVKVMDGVASVSAGNYHNMILKTDGTLWACGQGYYGQLGNDDTSNQLIPVKVMDDVASVFAGYLCSFILKTDGSLWACGNNSSGRLGIGNTDKQPIPVKVMDDVSFVSANGPTMIIKTDGSLWACGGGLLGINTDNRTIPVKVMDNVAFVATGAGDGGHTMIIKTDGSLWGCGKNSSGQLGIGNTDEHPIPVKVMDDVASVSAGSSHTMIVKSDGSLWSCGANNCGQLGIGKTEVQLTPVKVTDGVASVSAGNWHNMIIMTDGSLWGCGDNRYGALGYDTNVDYYTPVLIAEKDTEDSLGDANSDGEVNITDITYIIDKINDMPASNFNKKAADLNGDGEINITDVTLLLDIINGVK